MSERELPWLLKDTPFFLITVAFAPLALALLLLYWKRFDKKTRKNRLIFSSIVLFLFSISLLPYNQFKFWLGVTLLVFFYAALAVVSVQK